MANLFPKKNIHKQFLTFIIGTGLLRMPKTATSFYLLSPGI